jgi:hypothetical protein
MEAWHKETTPNTTGSRCTIRDENGLFVAECIASDAMRIAAVPAMLSALQAMISIAEREYCYLAHSGTEEGKVLAQARAAIALAAGLLTGEGAGDGPTAGEFVTIRADHLAALAGAASAYTDDLEAGLADGTYEDRADLDAVQNALAAIEGGES